MRADKCLRQQCGFLALAAALILSLALPAYAGGKVYKWTDAQGKVHYDSRPPAGGERTIAIEPQTGHSEPVNYSASSPTAKQDKAHEKKQGRITLKDPKRCSAAKRNLKALTRFGHVKVKDDDGSFHYLTEKEQQEKIKQAKKAIAEAC